jgi:hypothetical protein
MEVILALIMVLMLVFDQTIGKEDITRYFSRHLAVEATSILAVFSTIAIFMVSSFCICIDTLLSIH